MPEELKLGKLPPKFDKRTVKLSSIIRRELLPELPPIYDNHEIYGIVDNFMYANNEYGCCVISSRGHHTLVLEGFEQGEQIAITDQEITDEYFEQTGGVDRGLVLLTSLNDWRNDGWLVGGMNYTIYAYASVDWPDHDEVRHCVHLLGGVNFGMKVYQTDMEQFNNGEEWHLTGNNGNLKGRHGVYLCAYDNQSVICMTWGKRQKMTWDFLDARIDEAYGIVDSRNPWLGEDSPVDTVKLDAYLQEITEGRGITPTGCLCQLPRKSITFLGKVFNVQRHQL